MSRPTFTPGPWRIDADGSDEDRGGSFAIRAGQFGVASVWHQSGGAIGGTDNEANARLIAAAPELLAVADDAALGPNETESWEQFGKRVSGNARAAISKAVPR